MANKILDLNGLTYYDNRIKNYIKTQNDNITSNLEQQIASETEQRINEDTKLQNNIDSESKLRESADNILQDNIDIEQTERESAVLKLQQDKLDKVTTTGNKDRVYAVTTDGKQQMYAISQNDSTDESIAQRTSTGQLVVASPTEDNHSTNKQYVDNLNNNNVKLTGANNQVIAGGIQIQGNLTVNGTTITNDTETLTVKDNVIVTNSGGTTLNNLSGLAIKIDPTNVYGIMYDPSGKSVKLGEGKLDSNNEFTFNAGEGEPIVIRDDDSKLSNNHLFVWDSINKKIIDSGIDKDVVTTLNTDQTISGRKTFKKSILISPDNTDFFTLGFLDGAPGITYSIDSEDNVISGIIFYTDPSDPRIISTGAYWSQTKDGDLYEVYSPYNKPTPSDIGAQEKLTAGTNILISESNVISVTGIEDENAVKFTPQSLTVEQAQQARSNIRAQEQGTYLNYVDQIVQVGSDGQLEPTSELKIGGLFFIKEAD